ncbi:MAG: acyltransferase [Chloroflexi bacterium]|nr:acyltransferase [Chloroflexota bacterium]
MSSNVWAPLQWAASLHGILRKWFVFGVYLPLVRHGQDIDKVNVMLAHADGRYTRWILEAMGASLSPTAFVETHLLIHNARPDYRNLRVGPGCYVGKDCFFDLSQPVTLEEGSTLAMRVTVITHFEGGQSAAAGLYALKFAPVTIGARAYVGAGAIILPGLHISENAIVAAGAVVTKDVAANSLVGGVPARLLRGSHVHGDEGVV